MALTTLANAKDHLNIPTANTDFDSRITRFINAASEQIENYLDRKLLTASYTEYKDGRNSNRMMVKQFPVTAVAGLYIDDAHLFTDPSTLIASTEYKFTPSGEIILYSRAFPRGEQNVKIVYTAGYTAITDMPVIENSCLWVVEWYYDMQGDRRVGNKSKGKNNETVSFHSEWPSWLLAQLDPYKRCEWPGADSPVENF